MIFPEGTRSKDGEVGRIQRGMRKILGETPLPVVVAALEGGWKIAKIKDLVRNLGEARFSLRVLSVTPVLSGKSDVIEAISGPAREIAADLAQTRGPTTDRQS